jgi:hypothetical protein
MALAAVNWLLSALAQASTALIAILGGLLVSRYVALHAEQQAARRRVEDLVRREAEAKAHLEEAKRDLDLYLVDQGYSSDRTRAGRGRAARGDTLRPPAEEHVPAARAASVEAEDGLVEVG